MKNFFKLADRANFFTKETFSTKKEAQKFAKENGLTDYIPVKFIKGGVEKIFYIK